MFTVTVRLREREREGEGGAGHSKFHLSDLLVIAVYFGDVVLFSLARHFDDRPAQGTKHKTKKFTNVIVGHSNSL